MTWPDPNFDPQNPQNIPIEVKERAERLGTWRKIDRTRQYDGPERAHPLMLLDAVNKQGNKIRALEIEKQTILGELLKSKDDLAKTKETVKELKTRVWYYKFKSAALSAVLGAAAYSGIKLAATALAAHLLR